MNDRRLPLSVVEAILAVSQPAERLGYAVLLYVALLRHASINGSIVCTGRRLAEELAVPEERIARWIHRLADAGLLRIHSPLPCLAAQFVSWSGSPHVPSISGHSASPHIVNSYSKSSSMLSSGAEAIGDGGAGEGELKRLGHDVGGLELVADLPAILSHHGTDRVARILRRVRDMPDDQIKKSRLALFRYLITHDTP